MPYSRHIPHEAEYLQSESHPYVHKESDRKAGRQPLPRQRFSSGFCSRTDMYQLLAEEHSPLRDLSQRLYLCIFSYIKTPYDLSILHFGERIHYKVIGGADFVKTTTKILRISRDFPICFDFLSFFSSFLFCIFFYLFLISIFDFYF